MDIARPKTNKKILRTYVAPRIELKKIHIRMNKQSQMEGEMFSVLLARYPYGK